MNPISLTISLLIVVLIL
ncbi:hypothetical protein, partial [Paenibacillus taichungensis]